MSTEKTVRFVEQSRREAGTPGPSRFFYANRVGFLFGVAAAYDDDFRTSTADGLPVTLEIGSRVDFVVTPEPGSNIDYDDVRFDAQISRR